MRMRRLFTPLYKESLFIKESLFGVGEFGQPSEPPLPVSP